MCSRAGIGYFAAYVEFMPKGVSHFNPTVTILDSKFWVAYPQIMNWSSAGSFSKRWNCRSGLSVAAVDGGSMMQDVMRNAEQDGE